ncbi:hypothetical protein [Nocardia mexicana]|uniref:Uncharacterized protein n=1 Tax=Nocardia mexicana TaxID=279262 RepID=A0A370HG71_9NOCA|nr:hypothetical protein [Nocardia mexicana]RDI55776.1 hypothetical protein DFR68_101610 [Nocardia mexicana]
MHPDNNRPAMNNYAPQRLSSTDRLDPNALLDGSELGRRLPGQA